MNNEYISNKIDFDDGSRIISEKIEEGAVLLEGASKEEFYDISKVISFIVEGGFERVALQFPDSMLSDVSSITVDLEIKLSPDGPLLFALGDTSYGSCCVDEVNAQHLGADALVHFGPACLSPTSRLPICYVFGRNVFEVKECAENFNSCMESLDSVPCFVLLYEVGYHYKIEDLEQQLTVPSGSNLLIGRVPQTLQSPSQDVENPETLGAEEEEKMILAGLEVPVLQEENLQSAVILFLGGEGRSLTNLLMRCNQSRCFSFDPNRNCDEGSKLREETGKCNKALMRRFYLVQKAKEASIFGLVIGTLGVAGYLETIKRLQALIKNKGRKAYTFAVGKINVAKLANFAEVEAFVLVACPENSLLDSREFHAPIITPLELEVALGTREWGFYSMRFNDITIDQFREEEKNLQTNEEDKDAPYFSLVSGTYRDQRTLHTTEADPAGDTESVQGKEIIAYQSPAADFLQSREFRGLEQAIGKSKVHPASEGQVGIASDYSGV